VEQLRLIVCDVRSNGEISEFLTEEAVDEIRKRQYHASHAVLVSIEILGYRLDKYERNGMKLDVARLDELKSVLDLSFKSIYNQTESHHAEMKSTVQEIATKQDTIRRQSADFHNPQDTSSLKDVATSFSSICLSGTE
jgi:hypothetical protein